MFMDRLKIAQYLYQLIVFQVEFEIQRLFSNIYFKNDVPFPQLHNFLPALISKCLVCLLLYCTLL